MPILDLVTPWAAATRATEPRELDQFLTRFTDLLEPIRRQRAPTEVAIPAPGEWEPWSALAADMGVHQLLRDARDRLVDRGLAAPRRIVLLATTAPGGPVEVIPDRGAETVAIFVDRLEGEPRSTPSGSPEMAGPLAARLRAAIACGMAALTRWTTPDNPVATIAARGRWDRWAAAREVPLAEWVYAAGIGVHAALTLGAPTTAALGCSEGDLRRLRQAERTLQSRLDADLDRAGMGLVMRWLEDVAPVAMRRTADGTVIPPGAGRYLGWRMLTERVERIGLAEAAQMAA